MPPTATIARDDTRAATKAILAAGIGNLLEYYDFGVYGFMATVISRRFFPSEDANAALLATFAVFGVAFLARPLGGAILGRMGDIKGRRSTLILTISLMAVGTAGIGLIPDYASIGLGAPLLLLLCRVLQGLSTGGEWGNATAFIVEWSPETRRGFYGSFSQSSIVCGGLTAATTVAIMNSLFTPDQVAQWAWRLPFLLGILLLPIGLWLRRDIDETPRFLAERRGESAGLADLGSPLGLMLRAFGFTVLWTVCYYVMLTYFPTFTQRHAGLSPAQALWCGVAGQIVLVLSIPAMGALSDRVGRKPMLLACCAAFLLLSYPGFMLILSLGVAWKIALVQMGFCIVIALFGGTGPAALVELFPTRSRATLMSVGYSLAVAVFGGFAPFIATWLIGVTGTPLAPTFYLMASAIVSGLTILAFRETAFERLR